MLQSRLSLPLEGKAAATLFDNAGAPKMFQGLPSDTIAPHVSQSGACWAI